MSEWKCEICNSSFENFEARGFDNKIYCPLCYYKKLYKDTELEIERLNNIIKEVGKYLDEWNMNWYYTTLGEDQQRLEELIAYIIDKQS